MVSGRQLCCGSICRDDAKDAREVQENPVVVFMTDHANQKVPTVGASVTATILAGKLKTTSRLKSGGDNRM